MTEPTTPSPADIPEPFGSAPLRPAGSTGCGKPVIMGCLGVLVLLGIGAILFMVKAKDILVWTFDQMENAILLKLPDDLPDEERERLGRAFDAASQAAVSGQPDPVALQELQGELVRMSGRVEDLTREDVRSLTEALERFGGIQPEVEPEPIPPPSAEAEENGLSSV